MGNDQNINERLDRLEAQLAPVIRTAKALEELKNDVLPLLSGTVQTLSKELGQVETGFQLDDFYRLLIKGLRSVRYLTYSLEQLESVVDFVRTVEPLLKSSVPQLINYLDDLEQRGVLRIIQAGLGIRSKIASAYSAEDVENIGDGMVSLLGLLKKLSDPKAREFLEKLAEIPSQIDLSACKEIGPVGFLAACGRDETKQGLGVLVELTKAMGKMKS